MRRRENAHERYLDSQAAAKRKNILLTLFPLWPAPGKGTVLSPLAPKAGDKGVVAGAEGVHLIVAVDEIVVIDAAEVGEVIGGVGMLVAGELGEVLDHEPVGGEADIGVRADHEASVVDAGKSGVLGDRIFNGIGKGAVRIAEEALGKIG